MEPSFSFGRLTPPTIGNGDEEEPKPEDSERRPHKERIDIYQSPPSNKPRIEHNEQRDTATTAGEVQKETPQHSLYFSRNGQQGAEEFAKQVPPFELAATRDSLYQS